MTATPKLRVGVIGGSREASDLISLRPEAQLFHAESLPDRFGADAIIDASHPCERRTPLEIATRCTAQNIPLMRLRRPVWPTTPADNWIEVDDTAAALAALHPTWSRVFLCLGKEDRDAFASDTSRWYLVRTRHPSPEAIPFNDFEVTPRSGPFTVEEEKQLMTQNRIDVLVARHAGGEGAIPKVLAAREMGLPVIMFNRPAPVGAEVASVPEALAWLDTLSLPGQS